MLEYDTKRICCIGILVNKNIKKVLGLDIGSNSIGFSLLELDESNREIIFKELIPIPIKI